ncbi:sensor histidine kinase [Paenibacillus sp. GCM10023248]|uniref:sensor histidine kinase n=1 Tax=unclassified Paenibacillus TaxID=185978 RepID=UPI00237965AA|nr:ATP-binding protein [Paenibacillus sp. MAHUQ-63]MDD9271412.1 ATP-binding protein [Paenibacillus sp. MAHUQ-63]
MYARKIFLFGFFVVIFLIVQIWCSYLTFHTPYIGINVNLNKDGQWEIIGAHSQSVSEKLGLAVGDIVKLVDGKPPEESEYVIKWGAVEQANQILISRDGVDLEYAIFKNSTTLYDMIPLAEEFVCLLLACLLLLRLRHSPSAKLLSVVFFTMAAIYMSLGASIRGDVLGKIVISTFMMILPFVFLHFIITFFQEKGEIQIGTTYFKYIYAGLLAVALCRGLYLLPSMINLYHLDGIVTLSAFIIGFLISLCVIAFMYLKVRNQQTYLSSIVKSVCFSLFISIFPIICLSFLPKLLLDIWVIDAIYTSWTIILFPISFIYLIASNQLYDIGLVIRRFIFAGLVSFIPVSLFTGMYAFLFSHEVNQKQILFVFVGSIILVSLLLYAAEYWTTRLEPFLFPRKHVLQSALKKISKNLGAISTLRELKDIILVDIVNTLQVLGGVIVFQHKDEIEIIAHGEVDTLEIERLVRESALLHHPDYTSIEMTGHEAYTGYLIMSRKKTNMRISKEEKQWLQLITSYLEISLENVHLIRKLTSNLQQVAAQLPNESTAQDIQWFRKVMFELQEEERVRIANDLHDTTMQDLFFLKRRISSISEKGTLDKSDLDQLHNMNNFVDMINASLRQSCFELNPHLLKELGLIQTLRMYIEKEAYTAPFDLVFETQDAARIEHVDLPTKRHIFRIVQELLNNAKKHSQSEKVQFSIDEAGQHFFLNYEDDGVGFTYKEGSQKEIGASGMGIEQMRSRIIHIGGHIDIQSTIGQGTRIKMWIPIEEVITA